MSDIQLDPRAVKVQTVAKYTGVGLVAVAASGAIVVAGASVITASVVGVAALAMINFVVPMAARSIAVWKQKGLTAIAESFSEETIREDEKAEEERINVLKAQFKASSSNIQNAQDELRKQLPDATEEEKALLNSQVQALQTVIQDAENTLQERIKDFDELKRTNKMYIALHRAGEAMLDAQGAKRNSEQIQQLETARTAIKTRMRAAMAGQKIAQMDKGNKLKSGVDFI